MPRAASARQVWHSTRVAAAAHKERPQMGMPRDHAAGLQRQLTGPRLEATLHVRDRDMDRHAMKSELRYLFSGLWKGKGRRRRAEKMERQRWKRERNSGCKLKIGLPQWMGREWEWLVS